MIQLRDLTKTFEGKTAVDHITVDVEGGEILGLLGPNGAGKTTTSRMLACLFKPDAGEVVINGLKVGKDDNAIRRTIGITTEVPGLYERLSALRNLQFFAELYGVDNAGPQIEKYMRMLDLWDRRADRAGSFSKGMKQKLALARALVHEPRVLLLDEPTSGLDPQVAQSVRDFILKLKDEGRTILLCTHNLDEAERLCNRIAVLKTRLIAVDTPQALRRRLFGRRVVIQLRELSAVIIETVKALPYVQNVDRSENRLLVQIVNPESDTPELIRKLVAAGADIQSVVEEQHSLSDVYFKLVETR